MAPTTPPPRRLAEAQRLLLLRIVVAIDTLILSCQRHHEAHEGAKENRENRKS